MPRSVLLSTVVLIHEWQRPFDSFSNHAIAFLLKYQLIKVVILDLMQLFFEAVSF
jgi:hypothetical protein